MSIINLIYMNRLYIYTFKLNMGHEEKSCYIGSSFVFMISQGPYFYLKVSHICIVLAIIALSYIDDFL